MASTSSRVSTPTSAVDVGEGERDFSQSQLKPAPLRLTRKSLSSTTDHGLFQDAREVQPEDTQPLPVEHPHQAMLPLSSPPRPAGPGLAGLVSRFEVLGMPSQPPLQPSNSRRPEHQGRSLGPTAELKRSGALQLDSPLLTTGSPVHEAAPISPSYQGSMGEMPPIRTSNFSGDSSARRHSAGARAFGPTRLPVSAERKGWDPSIVTERRKMFEKTFEKSRPSYPGQDTSAKTAVMRAAVAPNGDHPMSPKTLLPKSATWTYDQHAAYHHSAQSSASSVSDVPMLKKQQHPAEPHFQAAVADQRQKKSVADLRRSFELASRSSPAAVSGVSPSKAAAVLFTPNKAVSVTDRLAGWSMLPAAVPARESTIRSRELPRNSAAFAGLWLKPDASETPVAATNNTLRAANAALPTETPTPTRPKKQSTILHSSPIHPFLLPNKSAGKHPALESAAGGTDKSGTGVSAGTAVSANVADRQGPVITPKGLSAQPVDDDSATKVADLRRLFDRHSHATPFLPFLSKRRETAPTKAPPADAAMDFSTGTVTGQAQPIMSTFSAAGLVVSSGPPPAAKRAEGRGKAVPAKMKQKAAEGSSDSGTGSETRRRHKLKKKRRDSPIKDRICLFESLSQSSLSLTTAGTTTTATTTARAKSYDADGAGKRQDRGSGELGRKRLSSQGSSHGSKAWKRFSAGAMATLRDRRKNKTRFSAAETGGGSLDVSQDGDLESAMMPCTTTIPQSSSHPQVKGKQRSSRFSLRPTHTLRFRRNSSIFHVTSSVQRVATGAVDRMQSEPQCPMVTLATGAVAAAGDAAAAGPVNVDTGSSFSSTELVDEPDHVGGPNVVLHASGAGSDRALSFRKSYGALDRKNKWGSNLGVDGTPAEAFAGTNHSCEVRHSMTAPHISLGIPGLGMGTGFGAEVGAIPIIHPGRGHGVGRSTSSRQIESRRSSDKPSAAAGRTIMTLPPPPPPPLPEDGFSRFRHSSSWGRMAGAVPFRRRRRMSQGASSAAGPDQDAEKLSDSSDGHHHHQGNNASASWSRRAAAAAFGIGQRLKEQRRTSNNNNNNNSNNSNSNSNNSNNSNSNHNDDAVVMQETLSRGYAGHGKSKGTDTMVAVDDDDMVVATPECGLEHPRPSRVLNITRFKSSFGKDRVKTATRL